jgi:hypothetical protein
MRSGPGAVLIERALGAIAKPSVAVAALFRDLIHVIVDRFVPVAEKGAVAADLCVTWP